MIHEHSYKPTADDIREAEEHLLASSLEHIAIDKRNRLAAEREHQVKTFTPDKVICREDEVGLMMEVDGQEEFQAMPKEVLLRLVISRISDLEYAVERWRERERKILKALNDPNSTARNPEAELSQARHSLASSQSELAAFNSTIEEIRSVPDKL